MLGPLTKTHMYQGTPAPKNMFCLGGMYALRIQYVYTYIPGVSMTPQTWGHYPKQWGHHPMFKGSRRLQVYIYIYSVYIYR